MIATIISSQFVGDSDQGQRTLSLLLWELYYDKPIRSFEMFMTLATSKSSIPRWAKELPPTQSEAKRWDSIFSKFPRVCEFLGSRRGNTSIVEQVGQDIEKKKQDPFFRFFRKPKFSKISFYITNHSSSLLRNISSGGLFHPNRSIPVPGHRRC